MFGVILCLLVLAAACGDDSVVTTSAPTTASAIFPSTTTATRPPPATTLAPTTTEPPKVETAHLAARCQTLDLVACDLLFFFAQTVEDSDLAGSCAGEPRAAEFSQFCSWDDQAGLGEAPVYGGPVSPLNPGDHPLFDELYDLCGTGIGDACDVLCHRTPFLYDPFYSAVGDRLNSPLSEYKRRSCRWWVQETGDDPFYDELERACVGGGYAFCDYLMIVTGDLAVGYRAVAENCGGRTTVAVASCVDAFGFDSDPAPALDAVAEECRLDLLSCDELRYAVGFVDFGEANLRGDLGYQAWAQTCGLLNTIDLTGSCAAIHGGEAERDSSGRIVGPGRVSVFEVRVGDCFERIHEGLLTIANLVAIPCERLHDHEVFALPEIGDGPDADFPAGIDAQAGELCRAAFEGYVGTPVDESRFGIGRLPPSRGSWETGDREVICWITVSEGEMLEGSVKGSGE
jgi:hypothetical protein